MRGAIAVQSLLLKMLKTHSFEKKEVTLASGRKSNFYINCKKTFLQQEGMARCAGVLLEHLRYMVIDEGWGPVPYVAGTGVGGGPLSAAMVMLSFDMGNRLDALYVRKETKDHGSRQQVEPGPGSGKVVLVEDVITTGGSAIEACNALHAAGYTVEGVIALVDRQEGGVENINGAGYRVSSVFVKDDFFGEE